MKKFFDSLVIGLALFAMFFGAGNLIFPPYLGLASGENWIIGFIVYFIFDIGLAMIGIFAMMRNNCKLSSVTGQVGKIPSLFINIILVICIGPVFVIPRTAATTFEMLSSVNVIPRSSLLIFSLIYFAIVLILTIRPTKVVDIVGKLLTPILFFGLTALIIYGIVNPLGPISESAKMSAVVKQGVTTGYQTMDVFGGLILASILIDCVIRKGYKEHKTQSSIIGIGCIIASVLLLFVYGGLTYLGASSSAVNNLSIDRASLLVNISSGLMGKYGSFALCIIVGSACLTTAIGLTSSCADYFEELSNKKISYKAIVLISIFVSMIISNMGLNKIIEFAGPILNFTYPIVLVMITLSMSVKHKNPYIQAGAICVAFVVSLLSVINSFGYDIKLIQMLPLYEYDLHWIIPAVAGGAIGGFVGEFIKLNRKSKKIKVLQK